MRYVKARLETENRETTYRYYIADTIYYNNQNPRQYISQRLDELYNPVPVVEESEEDVIGKLVSAGIIITRKDDAEPT